jgi:hypothetical protein
MLEMINTILLGYYLVVAVALLVFLAWRYIDDRRQVNWRGRKAGGEQGAKAASGTEPEPPPARPADPDARPPVRVVKFRRDR